MRASSDRRPATRRRLVAAALVGALAVPAAIAAVSTSPVGAASGFKSLTTPKRLVDTRPDGTTVDGDVQAIGARAAGSTLRIPVAGRAGVWSGADAAVLNITAIDATQRGFATVYPCGEPRPNASNLNFDRGEVIANLAVASVGTNGEVCLYTLSKADFVVDVAGFFPKNALESLDAPQRLLDTRSVGAKTADRRFAGAGARRGGTTLELPVAGRAGVAPDATSVALNVTAVDGAEPGFVTVYPCDAGRPGSSSVNFGGGIGAIPNAVLTGLSANGTVCLYVSARVDVLVDVSASLPGSTFTPLASPKRLMDSRPGEPTVDGPSTSSGKLVGGTPMSLRVAGRAGVPSSAAAVVLNVTVTQPESPGFVSVYPKGAKRPNASNVNYTTGQTIPNAVVARVGAGGEVCLFSHATAHYVVDVVGYLPGTATAESGGCGDSQPPPTTTPPTTTPPTTPPTTTPPTTTPGSGGVSGPLVPSGSRTHLGANVSKFGPGSRYDNVLAFEDQLGRQFAIINRFHEFSSGVESSFFYDRKHVADGRTVMISWRATDNAGSTSGQPDPNRANKIVQGVFDAEIRAMADQVKSLGAPVLIRFNWEMDQSPGATQYIGTPAEFIAAWRYVHDVFDQRGADNAVWVWAPRAASFNKDVGPTFYPGDAYVDWIGGSAVPISSFRDPQTIYGAWYEWGSQKNKPMLMWLGLRENPNDATWKADFLTDLQGLFEGPWPNVKAFVYYHADSPKGYDYWADTSTRSWNAFRALACSDQFHTVDTC